MSDPEIINTEGNSLALDRGDKQIIGEYHSFLDSKDFPCVAAKAALGRKQVHCFTADHMACPKDDQDILSFLYDFVDVYRSSKELYHTAAIIFKQPQYLPEEAFDELLWQRLQSLSNRDAVNYGYDKRVNFDPQSPDFSYSLKEEAFFIIGLHPGSSRPARQFAYPTLVFNPHQQFETLRETSKYQNLKYAVRKRDIAIAGSVNPMLEDFGNASEVFQYSGRQYNDHWRCPLNIKHERSANHSTP